MRTKEDIESFLIEMDTSYDLVGENIWVIKHTGPDLVVSIAGPLLIFRVKVIDESEISLERRTDFFRRLLELNASEMIHGSYGLEEGAVVITAALELENLDYNEFQASMEDMTLAVAKHYPILSRFVD